jgi:low temperature requirement protein LtrA
MAGQPDGFIVAAAGLRALQLLLYARAARHLPATRPLYRRYLTCGGIAGLFRGASLPASGQPRYALRAAALAAHAAGELAALAPSRRVPLNSWHLAERFQKFVLIVLGLSVAGLISAAAQRRWSVPLALVLTAAVLTLAALWWAWIRAADRDALDSPPDIARFAAANLPIVAGIAAASAGLHLTILAAGSTTMLPLGPRVALYGGVSTCLAATALMPASTPITQVRTVRLAATAAVTALIFPGAVALPVYLVPTLALLLATALTAEARLDTRPSPTRKYTQKIKRWRDLPTIPLHAADPR